MRFEKQQMVEVISSRLKNRPSVFISYQGLKANVFNEFRGSLTAIGAECHVVPNTLVKKAAEKLGMNDLASAPLMNDTAMVSGECDAVQMAKMIREFAKSKSQVKIKFGVLDGRLLSASDVEALSDLPSREVLLAQLLGVLQAPGSQLVRVLNAKLASIVYVLDAYCKKKEQVA